MDYNYSDELNVQLLLALFKKYNIRRVIASPGAINIAVVASMQQDPYFQMYSCVDERSAAYLACGLAEETGEPVVLSCTGATASRNYMSALTEAYYRRLPVIALTSSRDKAYVGHLYPQVTDRQNHPNDIIVDFAHIQIIKDNTDRWDVSIKLNRVLNSLKKGPVHINLSRSFDGEFNTKVLPEPTVIPLIEKFVNAPSIPVGAKVGVFVGEHKRWTPEETKALDCFCASHNAIVVCDHTSKFHGESGINPTLMYYQNSFSTVSSRFDILVHIGGVSGAYLIPEATEVWRVNEEGLFQDYFKKLKYVFKSDEKSFFEYYTTKDSINDLSLVNACREEYEKIYKQIPELPFSNLYIGKEIGEKFPDGSVLYLGILNTLRTWNYIKINKNVDVYSNVGGFGIDGTMSSLIGASLASADKLYFCVLGDLSFFYDMNSLGNRHIGNNVRIMVVNNGKGIEFRNYDHEAAFMGEDADKYVAAAGHWGNKSENLVKHFSEDLGYEYISAKNKEEFARVVDGFLTQEKKGKPIVFEVFTDSEDESNSLRIIRNTEKNKIGIIKDGVRSVVGEKGVKIIRSILKK